MSRDLDLSLAARTARKAVEAAARVSVEHYRRGLEIRRKTDRTLVTSADRASEAEIVRILRDRFPSHTVLTEESGLLEGDPSYCWVVDPLDGTLGFSRGGSHWGPLVALEHEGDVVAGAMALPALGRIWYASRGGGCFGDGKRVRLGAVRSWSEAVLSLGEIVPLLRPPHGDSVRELIRSAASVRCHGDLAGIAMVLDGVADLWLEAGVEPWDIAPAQVLIEEAGGRFSDFTGRASIRSGQAVAGGPALHEHALQVLRRGLDPR